MANTYFNKTQHKQVKKKLKKEKNAKKVPERVSIKVSTKPFNEVKPKKKVTKKSQDLQIHLDSVIKLEAMKLSGVK